MSDRDYTIMSISSSSAELKNPHSGIYMHVVANVFCISEGIVSNQTCLVWMLMESQ